MKSASLGAVVFGLLLNTSVTANAELWLTETVDSGFLASPSIAVDSLTRAHISYVERDNMDLVLATNASGFWVMTTVDSVGDVGKQSSIAVDSLDNVHISYRDMTTTDLKYATNASGSWVTTTVDTTGVGPTDMFGSEEGAFNSIAVDSSGKVHISYRDLATTDLKYATNGSGSWVATTVDSDVGWSEIGIFIFSITGYTSIAVDNSNKVHISYVGEEGLRYATNVSGSWALEVVDSDGIFDASIEVDSSDKVHINYNRAGGGIQYATKTSGSWATTTVDSTAGGFVSIAVDSSDKVHIPYFRVIPIWPGTAIAFLLHATNASGTWVTTPVDVMGTLIMSGDVSLSLDRSDKVHTTYLYYDPDNDDGIRSHIKYATNEGCFIATAAFGTQLEPRIDILRSFRDLYLMNSSTGKAFIRAYNKYSPPLADYIAERGWMRTLVRTMLLPIIGIVSLFV